MRKETFQLNKVPAFKSIFCCCLILFFSVSTLFADTVRDEFLATSYSNNNGTAIWTIDWLEINEADRCLERGYSSEF